MSATTTQATIEGASHAGCMRKFLGQQKIAIAVYQRDRRTALGQRPECIADFLMIRVGEVVVAGPVFKQITQHIQRPRATRRAGKKLQQQGGDVWTRSAEVQVGYEKCRGGAAQHCSARSITTSSTGTS